MSTNNFPLPNYKYKSSTLRNRSYNPKIIKPYDTSTLKVSHYTQKKPTFISINGLSSYTETPNYLNLTSDKYIYQDECPDSNVIFFNSNLQKYRIDSLGRKQIIHSNSKSTEKYYISNIFTNHNEYRPNRTLNYSLNKNQSVNEYRRNANIISNKNREISNKYALSNGRMNNSENLSINLNKYSYLHGKTVQKGNISTNLSIQNKYGGNTLNNLNLNKYTLSSNQNKNIIGKLNMTYNQNNSLNNKANQNKYQYQFQDENKIGNINKKRLNNNSTFNKNDIDIRKDILKRVEANKNESKFGQNKDNSVNLNGRRKLYLSQENKVNNNYNLRDAKTILLNSKENVNVNEDNKNKENNNLKNVNKDKLSNANEYLNKKDTNDKENKLSNSKQKLKENRFSRKQYQNQINQNNLNNYQNYQKEQLSGRKLQNINYNDDKNNNINKDINKDNQNQNVKIVNKTEEKTIVIIPGQTIEPKTINETFQNPIVETIKNEDGTTSSIIKQTKITTISENVPIGNEKINSIEGAPDLPMVKQYITYEYKTVTSPKDGKTMANQILKSQNKVFEEDKLYIDNYQGQNSEKKNLNEDLGNNNRLENQGIHRDYYAFNEENEKKEENIKNEEMANKENIKGKEGNNKDIQGDNIQSGLNEKQLDENFAKKRFGLSKNKNEVLHEENKEGSANQRIEISGKGSNAKSKGKNLNDIKYGKQDRITKEFSERLKKGKKREGVKSLEKSGKNKDITKNLEISGKVRGMKSLEKSNKNRKGMKNLEISDKNKDIMKNLEKLENSEFNNLKKKSIDKKKLDKAISAVENPLKESLKILSEGPQTKEEKLIIDIIKKGENATLEEKQKRFNFLSDLYGKCDQKGNKDVKEKNLEKLGIYLCCLGESEKKDILSKLKNNFPDNEELYNKLIGIISNKYSFRAKGKKEAQHETNSQNKNIFKKELENKNIKKKGGKKTEGIKGYKEISPSFNLDFKFRDYPEKVAFTRDSIREKGELSSSLIKGKLSETIEIKNINPLKFDGLFLEISKYENVHREKNPFEGPSPFDKFYKVRKTKIKKKIISMANEESNDEKINEKNKNQ